ncbi:MAG: aspartate/glutamate racemase family protein [Bacillota bacterium]
MARILVINPNTSLEMTEQIKQTVNSIAHSEHKIVFKNADIGPESLETFYEYNLATIGVLRVINREKDQFDGVLLACFGDPGIYALKEVTEVPLIGIAEASLSKALMLGQSFSILVALNKAIPMMENMVMNYGLSSRLTSVEALELPVLDLKKGGQDTVNKLLHIGKKAKEKGAEVLILGCAGMTGLSSLVGRELGVAVLDPIAVGYKTLEGMIEIGVNVSRSGLFAPPGQKKIIGQQLFNLEVVEKCLT